MNGLAEADELVVLDIDFDGVPKCEIKHFGVPCDKPAVARCCSCVGVRLGCVQAMQYWYTACSTPNHRCSGCTRAPSSCWRIIRL